MAAEPWNLSAEIGKLVHARIAGARVSQAAVAAVLGIHQSTLSKKLYGDVGWSAEDLITLAEVFKCDINDFVPSRPKHRQAKWPKDAPKARAPRRRLPLPPAG